METHKKNITWYRRGVGALSAVATGVVLALLVLGLGLWAARQMLDIVGADVTVNSTPLQGTEVTLNFPQAAPLRPGREGELHPDEEEEERNRQRDQVGPHERPTV